jgi:hypothetical protein
MHVPLLTADRPVGTLTNEEVLAATDAAGAIWSRAQVDCTSVETSVIADAPRDALPGFDQQNNVIFRDDSWSPKTFDKNGNPLGTYEPNQLALTTVSLRTTSGVIVDADIEINAFNHRAWEASGDMSLLLAHGSIDLQNTLSHEMGHVLGFEHSCWDPQTGAQPLDGDKLVPPCASNPQLAEATMAPTAPPGDITKRALHADDRDGVCDVYPVASGGGCAISGGTYAPEGRAQLALSALAALLGLATFKRRRLRSRRQRTAPGAVPRFGSQGRNNHD